LKGLFALIIAVLLAGSASAGALRPAFVGSRAALFPPAPLVPLPPSVVTPSGKAVDIVAWTLLPGGERLAVLGPLARQSGLIDFLGSVGFDGAPKALRPSPRFPDLTQTDRSLGLPLGGWVHCGPVAAADVLGALGLVDGAGGVAARLGGRSCMNTRLSVGGTPVAAFLEGLQAFFDEASIEEVTLEYQGWPSRPFRFGLVTAPRWEDIRLALASGGGAVLQVGWFAERKDVWHRRSGHWVALAGYDGERWFVADPGPWAGQGPALQEVLFSPLPVGTVLVAGGNRMEGGNYREVLSGLARPRKGERAVAEGVVLFWCLQKELDWGRYAD